MGEDAPVAPAPARWLSFLQDVDQQFSAKRAIAFICVLTMVASPPWVHMDTLHDIAWIAGLAIGGAGLERFGRQA